MKGLVLVFVFVFALLSCKNEVTPINSSIKIEARNTKDTLNLIKPKQSVSTVRLLGKLDYTSDSLFVLANSKYTSKPIYLNKECYESFKRMYDSAKAYDINLKIISGTRNFSEQKAIWERKWKIHKVLSPTERSKKILEYSSMPGTSRHHWGTDIDLNSLTNDYFSNGQGKKEYEWLAANANNFGFYQVYTSKDSGRTGYNEEKWHWSYLPIASKYIKAYNQTITLIDIDGFNGFETATDVNIINDFVNGISKKAKQYSD